MMMPLFVRTETKNKREFSHRHLLAPPTAEHRESKFSAKVWQSWQSRRKPQVGAEARLPSCEHHAPWAPGPFRTACTQEMPQPLPQSASIKAKSIQSLSTRRKILCIISRKLTRYIGSEPINRMRSEPVLYLSECFSSETKIVMIILIQMRIEI